MNFKLFFLIVIFTFIGAAIPFIYRIEKISSQDFQPDQLLYRRILPSDWLVGTAVDVGPSGQFESRYGTDFEDLAVGDTLSLGYDIKTGPEDDSTVSVNFDQFIDLNIGSDTRLSFSNTSTQNFLIKLNRGGNFKFTAADDIQFSIIGLNLLGQFNSAEGSIDITGDYITIELNEGSVTLAYNNNNYETQIREISSPRKIIFNDSTRKITLKNL